MRSSLFTFLVVCFSVFNAQGATNPWELNNLKKGQVIELEGIQFDMDAAILSDESKKSLEKLKAFLLNTESAVIELQGHTNGIPSHEYCDALSSKRAEAVRNYLIDEGVSPDKLIAKGYGKRLPIASNLNALGREANQRVDAKVISL